MQIHSSCRQTLLALAATAALLSTTSAQAANWPQFRGPTGLGYTEEKTLPVKWGGPKNENVRWKRPLIGQGHASPIVWGEHIFITTARWPAEVTVRESVIPEHHLLCYSVTDGQLQWDTVIPPGPWLRKDFRSGPGGGYAAPTPATDGKLVYCVFASSVIAAVDFQGKIQWRKEIVPYTFDVTIGASPILHGDTLILFCAMAKATDSQVIAYNKNTGEIQWQQKLPEMGFGHSTPVIVPIDGRPQMLVLASGMQDHTKALRSLDPANGNLLWWCRGQGDAASPAFADGLVYFDSGRGGYGMAVSPKGTGEMPASQVRWKVNPVPEGIGSPIIVGKHVFRLHTPGILKCWNVDTGKQLYAERLEGISSTWASPIADPAGNLYFANAGKSYVVRGGSEFQVVAINDLGDGSHPSPAAADGRLFLAGQKFLFCIENKTNP